MTNSVTAKDVGSKEVKQEIGKIVDRLHVLPYQFVYTRKNIALYPNENNDPEFINDNHRNALIDELLEVIVQAITNERERIVQRLEEEKSTMAHIVGAKRVETDYITLDKAISIIQETEVHL